MELQPYAKGDNSRPGQQYTGPTTCSQTQAQAQGQQEQGAKRPIEDNGDRFASNYRSHLMHMVRKLRKQGCDITLPAEF